MKWLTLCALICGINMIQGQTAQEIVKHILDIQTDAWNAGNIPDFMETYLKSEELQFLGSDGYTSGWQSTLDNYYRRYPNRQAMGQLTFTIHEANFRTKQVITTLAEYHLEREGMENKQGYFLLVLQKVKGKWLIVADSTH